eukprot:COSAG06_NODE_9319_length_1923_cov_11.299454_2_plen_53_part_00
MMVRAAVVIMIMIRYQVGMYGMMTGAPLVVILVSFVVYAARGAPLPPPPPPT